MTSTKDTYSRALNNSISGATDSNGNIDSLRKSTLGNILGKQQPVNLTQEIYSNATQNRKSQEMKQSHFHDPQQQAENQRFQEYARDARPILPKIAFFMGDLRDGLPMINMQSTFLMSAKHYTEKQIGVLFLVFGLSQFFMMPLSGYLLDYTNHKINWVQRASVATAFLTVFTAIFAEDYGENLTLMAIIKVVQGGSTTLLPLGLHSITLGIVGSTGMTKQVARNKVMNHLGTALIVGIGTLTAYFCYNNPYSSKLGFLFLVSPLACMALLYFLWMIKPSHVDLDAARGLIIKSPTMTELEELDEIYEAKHGNANEINPNTDECDRIDTTISTILSDGVFCKDGDTGSEPQHFYYGNKPDYVPPSLPASMVSPSPSSFQQGLQTPLTTNTKYRSDFSHEMTPVTEISAKDEEPSESESDKRAKNETPKCQSLTLETSSSKFFCRNLNIPSSLKTVPSYIFGLSKSSQSTEEPTRQAQTPLWVLSNPTLLIFTTICFFFHMGNSAILPLVMQTLTGDDEREGILMSGLCIFIAQFFMSVFAKISGDYSPIWGRKKLFLFGLFSLPVRCFSLVVLLSLLTKIETESGIGFVRGLILATQFLDAVGAGIFGTLYILVTSDIAAETGRFNLMIGVTSGAMCLGGTVSGYVGQSLAADYGYRSAFAVLGVISLVPAFMYLWCMPETLPDYVKPKPLNGKRRLFAQNFFLKKRDCMSDSYNSSSQQTLPIKNNNDSAPKYLDLT